MVSPMPDVNYSIQTGDGKYWVVTDTGERRSKRMTRRELNNAIKRSSSAVRIAEAVGQEVDPCSKWFPSNPSVEKLRISGKLHRCLRSHHLGEIK